MAEEHYTTLARMDHAPRKSWVKGIFDKLSFQGASQMKSTAKEGGLAVRQVGTGVVVGSVLGAIHAELKAGLDPHGVPIDAVVAVGGIAGALMYAGEEYAPDLRNVGTAGATIFAYRKTDAFLSEKKAARIAGETDMSGESGFDVGAEDPIASLARNL